MKETQKIDPWKNVIKNNKQEIYNFLTEVVDVNQRITMGNNLNILQVAVSEQKHEIVIMVQKHPSVQVDHLDAFGKTALHYACANGDVVATQLLLVKGANPNHQNNAGESPFMKACYFVERNLVEWMLENIPALDVNCKNIMGRSALDILKTNQNLRDGIPPEDPQLKSIIESITLKMSKDSQPNMINVDNETQENNISKVITENKELQENTINKDAMDEEVIKQIG